MGGNFSESTLLDLARLISKEMICMGGVIKGKTVLDVAAGPDTKLGKLIKKEGGDYIAFDIKKEYLKKHARESMCAVQGNIKHLPFRQGSVDVAHMSAFLHLVPPNKRKEIIRIVIDAASEKSVFVELECALFEGHLAHKAKELSIELRAIVLGCENKELELKLRENISSVLSKDTGYMIIEQRLPCSSGASNLLMCVKSLKISAELKAPSLLEKIESLLLEVKSEAKRGQLSSSIRNDIVAVTVLKLKNKFIAYSDLR